MWVPANVAFLGTITSLKSGLWSQNSYFRIRLRASEFFGSGSKV